MIGCSNKFISEIQYHFYACQFVFFKSLLILKPVMCLSLCRFDFTKDIYLSSIHLAPSLSYKYYVLFEYCLKQWIWVIFENLMRNLAHSTGQITGAMLRVKKQHQWKCPCITLMLYGHFYWGFFLHDTVPVVR